jgi:hypothetical protein
VLAENIVVRQRIAEELESVLAAALRFLGVGMHREAFDQDGSLWVEHPIYTQVVYCLHRVPIVVRAKPELAKVEPLKTVLTGDFHNA